MVEELVLDGLLVASLVFAVGLILVSSATVGRKLADLEFQAASGIDGVRRIQSIINVRTHINRVLLGIVFVVITMLLLADAPMWVRMWVNRILFALLLGSYAITACLDWLDERVQLRINTAQEAASHAKSFAAGERQATGVAEEKAEALALVTVVPPGPDAAPVAIQAIAPEAVADIVEAIKPGVIDAITHEPTERQAP